MATISSRLGRLERAEGGDGRTVIVTCGGTCSDEDIEAHLVSQGLALTRRDATVTFRTLYEDRDGGVVPSNERPSFIVCSNVSRRLASSR